MKVYLAGFETAYNIWKESTENIYILSSYINHQNGECPKYMKQDRHILDSGAYSAMNGTLKNIDWDKYVENYADFIAKNNIKHFIEMDIDSVVGLEKVEQLREKLEKITKKKCIPVWHRSRGEKYFLQMIKNYDYVALGGFAINEWKKKDYKYINWFLEKAKENNCKIHGLGITGIDVLKKYKFYSVDSTSWLAGSKYGEVCMFRNGFPVRIKKKLNKRVKDYKDLNLYNFKQWIKFQKYAEEYL